MSVTSDRTEPETNSGNADSRTCHCPQCGGAIAGRAVDGLCARCLMQLAGDGFENDDANVAAPETSRPPEQFGRYTIRRKLGQGAMGIVYLAKDVELGRLVAIKLPLFGRSSEAAVVERFQREIRAAAAIQHPNICPIYDVGQIDGSLFMTMAFIEGRPLSRALDEQTSLSVNQAVSLVRKLALALHAAHQRGVVHRDLKPANIMIDRRGEPIIMDFGLARRRDSDDARLTASGAIVGTPAYMSAEQVAGIEATEASDVYSLGVILYELVAGRLPFEGELVPLLNKIAHESPAPPSTYCQDAPKTIDAICLRALAKDPEERFASAEEMARELTRFLVQGDSSTPESVPATAARRSSGASQAAKTELKSDQQTRILIATAGATAVVTLVLLAAFAYFTNRTTANLAVPDDAFNGVTEGADSSVDLAPIGKPDVGEKEDIVVNYVLGRYLCFTERDWPRGLRYLARGADEKLKQLAIQDLAAAKADPERGASPMLAIADAWAEFAEEQTLASTKVASTERAKTWYELSLPTLGAANRERVETWLQVADGSARQPATADSSTEAAVAAANVHTYEPFEIDPKLPPLDLSAPESPGADIASTPDNVAAKSLSRFEQRCLKSLNGIGLQRQEMLAEMKQLLNQRDALLPQSHLKAAADYAQLLRLGEETTEEIRRINLRQGELLRMSALSENEANRRTMEFQLAGVRRERALAMQRYDRLALEAKGKRQELSELSDKMKAVNKRIIDWSDRAEELIDEAFWSLEPTGSLSHEAYQEMSVLLTRWLQTTEIHSAVIALRSLANCHCGQLEQAAVDAEEAVRLDPSFVLATAVRGYVRSCEGGAGEGIAEISRAVRLDGRQPACYLLRGLAYRARGSDALARSDFERVTALASEAATGHAMLALQLASSRDKSTLNGAAAITAAERACLLSDHESWICLAALAAARAEVGEFDEAIIAQERACSLASPRQRPSCELQLQLFQSGQPFRLN